MADDKSSHGLTVPVVLTLVLSGAGYLAVRSHLQSLRLPVHAAPDAQGYLQVGGQVAFGMLGQLVFVLAGLLLPWLLFSLLGRRFPALRRFVRARAVVSAGIVLLAAAALACELVVLDARVDLDALPSMGRRPFWRPVLVAETLVVVLIVWALECRTVVSDLLHGSFLQRQFAAAAILLVAVCVLVLPAAFGRSEMIPQRLDKVQILTERGELSGLLVFSDASSHYLWTERRAMTEIARGVVKEIRYEPRSPHAAPVR